MTVRDLITKLLKADPNDEVYISLHGVEIAGVAKYHDAEGQVELLAENLYEVTQPEDRL
jgi:microcystin degradation protein MlrC